ncbi:MAG: hypothetical protein U0T73_02835 [Chitinophagales bacterium]
MVKSFFYAIVMLMWLTGCSKLTNATINGYDYTKCACCGGYYVSINGQTYRAISGLENSGLSPLMAFPVNCKIAFVQADSAGNSCARSEKLIVVTKVQF